MGGKKRKSYSIEFKKRITEDSRNKNLASFCRERMLNIRMVRKWRLMFEQLSEQAYLGFGSRRSHGSGRQPFYLDLEDIVVEWIIKRKESNHVVTKPDIRKYALTMAPYFNIDPESFKASSHWLSNVIRRNELSLSSTALFTLNDDDVGPIKQTVNYLFDDTDFYDHSNMITAVDTPLPIFDYDLINDDNELIDL